MSLVLGLQPKDNPDATGDAYNTLLVARLSYTVDEDELKDFMKAFGSVVSVRIVRNKDGKPRGYGFVEFDSESALRRAFVEADARKIGDRVSFALKCFFFYFLLSSFYVLSFLFSFFLFFFLFVCFC